MSTQFRAFRPLANTQNIAVTASAQTVTLNYALGTVAVRVCNIGSQTVFMQLDGADATVNTSIPVPAGQTEVFTLSTGQATISVIAAGTGSTFYITVGEGM